MATLQVRFVWVLVWKDKTTIFITGPWYNYLEVFHTFQNELQRLKVTVGGQSNSISIHSVSEIAIMIWLHSSFIQKIEAMPMSAHHIVVSGSLSSFQE